LHWCVLLSQSPTFPAWATQSPSTQHEVEAMQSWPHFLFPVVQLKSQECVAALQVPAWPGPAWAAHSLSAQQPEVRTHVASLHDL